MFRLTPTGCTEPMTNISTDQRLILVTGGTGKTGRRVVHRLRAAGHPVRAATRRTSPTTSWRRRSPASGMSRRRATLKW
ncbi:NAD-dependent epimerase/dehydratase family protein [Nocardia asiatica]|uniref:NAD-dependent epimerase/dehydratase family protein n=1 Tax=Nocardia asiatica TaxID=209252 RepID=UPI003EE1877E